MMKNRTTITRSEDEESDFVDIGSEAASLTDD